MKIKLVLICLIIVSLLISCSEEQVDRSISDNSAKVRMPVDTVGFAQYDFQMDSVISRINADEKKKTEEIYKAAICPHDDYSYVGGMYTKTLEGIKAKTIILIGVAHKAKNYKLQDKLVFGSFDQWKSVYGNVKVSSIRNKLTEKLPKEYFTVNDSMMIVEHSTEAIIPFLQYKRRDIEIVPVLVPYMKFEDMLLISESFSNILYEIMVNENKDYGKDLAIVISNDAVHYGDEDWGSDDMAPFGTDSIGNEQARKKDLEIIDVCLKGELTDSKIKLFTEYTVAETDYKEYNWVWCGRYSVPFGLLTAIFLNRKFGQSPLTGTCIGYGTSNLNKPIEVKDIGMGTTAPANQHHWVGYAGMVYK